MRGCAAGAAALAVLLTACAPSGPGGGVLTVAAASSLAAPVTELAQAFEASHPGTRVEVAAAGSSTLVTQLREGAAIDVLVTADDRTMDGARSDRLVAGEPVVVATNTLTLVTPPDDPGDVRSFEDLGRTDVTTVVCAPAVPCGGATRTLAAQAGVDIVAASEEQSVQDVVAKVRAGEADAGVVYVTDARGAGDDVRVVPIAGADRVVNRYPAAVATGASDPELARAFVALLSGQDGREVLHRAGFGAP